MRSMISHWLPLFITLVTYSNSQDVVLDGDNANGGDDCKGAGWYINDGKCIECSVGYYCPAGITFAKQCEPGTFQDMARR